MYFSRLYYTKLSNSGSRVKREGWIFRIDKTWRHPPACCHGIQTRKRETGTAKGQMKIDYNKTEKERNRCVQAVGA